jgi:uncharacterized protein
LDLARNTLKKSSLSCLTAEALAEGWGWLTEDKMAVNRQSGTSNRGFASMDQAKQREIARKGGRSVPAQNRTFSRNHDLASQAGRKGGENSHGGVKRENRGERKSAIADVLAPRTALDGAEKIVEEKAIDDVRSENAAEGPDQTPAPAAVSPTRT